MYSTLFKRATRAVAMAAAAAALLLGGAVAAQAQQGTVQGRVVDQANLQPLVGAQVYLPGTQLGTLTDEKGNFRIAGVPAGIHEIRIRLIGYKTAVRNVTVLPSGSVTVDFQLSVSAVSLQEVVVTATGPQRQQELGHAVSTIDAASQVQKTESNSITNLIQGNATGVSIRESSGSVGTGSTIKIRGNSSISLDNTPLIYVDGIRVSNSNDISTPNSTVAVGGQRPTRLGDLDPQDIQSIDILKGPSAVTLYGTEAAAGVILITTKRGREGATRYNVRAEVGGNWDATQWPSVAYNPTNDPSVNIGGYAGVKDTVYLSNLLNGAPGIEPPFRTGLQNTYAASVRGGQQGINYFVSGQYQNQQGNLPNNDVTKWNGRANLSLSPSDKVDISISNGYVSNRTLLPQNDNNSLGYLGNGLLTFGFYAPFDRADPNTGGPLVRTCPFAFELARAGFGSLASLSTPQEYCGNPLIFGFGSFQDIGTLRTSLDINRYTGSATLTYRPVSAWTNRVTVGLDEYSSYQQFLNPVIPRLSGVTSDYLSGFVQKENVNHTNLTLEATSALNLDLTQDVSSTTTLGVQFFDQKAKDVYAQGRGFPAGSPSVGNALTNQADSYYAETKTLGVFGEQQFAWQSKIYVTGGLRLDENSAFGSQLGLKSYPRVSFSYILSDESWFPKIFDQFKLRGAWGESGKQPPTNAALSLLSSVAVPFRGQEIAGVTQNQPGNDSLKPELDKEFEAGFDASILNGRLSGSFTWYHQITQNAIVTKPLAPSLGFPNNQYTNVGRMTNTGIEASLDAVAFDMPGLNWEWQLKGSTNYNKITNLPSPIIYGLGGSSQRHEQGYPFGSYIQQRVTIDASGNPVLSANDVYNGDPTPNFTGSVASTLTLFNHVTLYALADWETGQQLFNATQQFMCNFVDVCPAVFQVNSAGNLSNQAKILNYGAATSLDGPFIENASYAKLRTASIRIALPDAWAAVFGAHRLSFSLVGNNLMTWTGYTGVDPELNWAGQSNASRADFLTLPPARSVVATMSVEF